MVDNPKGEFIMIFPTTILLVKNKEDFKKEFKYIRNLDYDDQQLTGVFRSKDSYLMKHSELSNLNKFFQLALDTYANQVMGTKSKLEITQAWVQRNIKNSFTHDHVHPNSIISGVFYFRNDDHAGISFSKDTIDRIALPKYTQTKLNSESFMLYPKSGDLVLFPSNIRHGVPINTKEDSRYCLAFNTFHFGELGSRAGSTHLIINKDSNGKSN